MFVFWYANVNVFWSYWTAMHGRRMELAPFFWSYWTAMFATRSVSEYDLQWCTEGLWCVRAGAGSMVCVEGHGGTAAPGEPT